MPRVFGSRARVWSAVALAMGGVWGSEASAMGPAAATGESTYTLGDLANKTLPVQLSGGARLKTGVQNVGTCQVDVRGSGSTWTVAATDSDGASCKSLWKNKLLANRYLSFPAIVNGRNTKIPVTFRLSPPLVRGGLPLTLGADHKTVSGLDKGRRAYTYASDIGWYPLNLGSNSRAELRGTTTASLTGGDSIRVIYEEVDTDNNLSDHAYVVLDPSNSGKATTPNNNSTNDDPVNLSLATCNGAQRSRTAYVCAVVRGKTISFEQAPPSVIPPNTSVEVEVVYPSNRSVGITLTGKRGVFIPGDRGTGNQAQSDGGQASTPVTLEHAYQTFAPREPGDADLKITITDNNNQIVAEKIFEFIIDKTYAGAVRLGVGVVFANAVDREYAARTVGNSQQEEIVATQAGNAGFELVLGYAPYAFDYIQNRGRGRRYANRSLGQRAGGFAPFAGIGLLEASGTGVEILKSVHMGLEWEPTPNFSVAVTAVARRVTRLADGLVVGSPITGDIPTREVIRWGAGLVLNFSAEFFRLATRESRSFYRQGE